MSPLKSAEVYDPHTNKWTPLPDMSSDRFGLGACHCDGKCYALIKLYLCGQVCGIVLLMEKELLPYRIMWFVIN